MIPTDTIDKLALCFASLSSLGDQLTEDQWKSPTDCPGWTVRDNVAHMIGTRPMNVSYIAVSLSEIVELWNALIVSPQLKMITAGTGPCGLSGICR